MSVRALRGSILHCLRDPGDDPSLDGPAVEFWADGLLVIENGHVAQLGDAQMLSENLGDDVPVDHYADGLIVPGLVDCHVHYPQTNVIASFGTQLLDWLNTYTFPAEAAFVDATIAQETAKFFIEELLRNGTTTALVFATVHAHSADALFEAATARSMRLATGKVLMDRHCPDNLRDDPASGYRESRALIERWHGQDRLHYAITPRFAPTSSDEQLRLAGQLAQEYPDVLVQTHLAENLDEVAWVHQLFPDATTYLDVYQQAGLLRERSVFAHCLHLHDDDYNAMATAGGAIAFCPTSNLFLGSGLFDLERARAHNIRVGLGTDVGGGTSFSLLRTLGDAYKVLQLQQQSLNSLRGLYLATLGGAESLYMDDRIGNFARGKEADCIVLTAGDDRLLQRRLAAASNAAEALFVQATLGDDRSVAATYILGERVED